MAMDPWGAKLMLMACLSASLGGCDRSANSHLAGGAAPTAAQSSRGVPTGAAISATWTDKTIPARWDPTVSVDDAWAELQAAVVTPLSEQLPGTLAAELRSNLRARFRSDISDLAVEQAVRGDWISLRTQAWNHGPMIGFRGMGRAGPIDLPQTLPTTGFTANLNPEQEWAQVRFAREMLRRLADLHAENFESWIGPALPPAGIDPDATQARVWKQGLCLHLTNQILEPWSWTDLDDLARLAPDGRISTNERQLLKDYMIRCVEDEWSQYLYEATVSRMLTWSGWSDEERRDVSRRALRGLFLVGNIHPPPSGCGRTVRYLHRLIRLDDGIEVEALWWVQNHWLSKGQVHQSALKLLIDRDDCRATELLRSLREGLPPVSGDESPELTDEDFARARPANEVLPPVIVAQLVRKPGRPPLPAEARKKSVGIRLSPDVLEALRATGPNWQRRADEALRAAFVNKDNAKDAA